MFKKPNCPVIAIEEHYWDEELEKTYVGSEAGRPGEQSKRLHDLGALRIKEMDEAGIDIQVLSHGAPSAQKLPAETAAALTRRVNDRLHAVVSKNPKRFAAFAALPTAVQMCIRDRRRFGRLSRTADGAVRRVLDRVHRPIAAAGRGAHLRVQHQGARRQWRGTGDDHCDCLLYTSRCV